MLTSRWAGLRKLFFVGHDKERQEERRARQEIREKIKKHLFRGKISQNPQMLSYIIELFYFLFFEKGLETILRCDGKLKGKVYV